MPIKIYDTFASEPQFISFISRHDDEEFITIQLSRRLDDEEARELAAIIDRASVTVSGMRTEVMLQEMQRHKIRADNAERELARLRDRVAGLTVGKVER